MPAPLELIPFTQPDGTVINIRLVGNGQQHFTLNEEGYLLKMNSEGFYCLADIDEKGMIFSTDVRPSKTISQTVGKKLADINISKLALQQMNPDGVSSAQSGMGMMQKNYPTTGAPVVPVFLVEFQDIKFRSGYDPKEYFENLLNGTNFEDDILPGSVSDYFNENSKGKFIPKFEVFGPVTLPQKSSYYGADAGYTRDYRSHKLVSDAAPLLQSEIDFSKYDFTGDGMVDFIYVIYAGEGQQRSGNEDDIWPHAGTLSGNAEWPSYNGKQLDMFACSNEWIVKSKGVTMNRPESVGPLIHEYSHILGLPDLYPTDAYNYHYFTPGPFSILDYGVYNNNSMTPCNYNAYERNALQWDEPVAIIDGPASVTLQPGEFVVIPTAKKTEFFLLENKQLTGWDEFLPNHGLVIWHIDYVENIFKNNEVSNKKDHLYVDLIEANGIPSFEKDGSLWWSNCEEWTFPGKTGATRFTAETTPAFLTWGNFDLQLPITNIKEKDGVVTFNVANEQPEEDDPDDDNVDNPGDDNGDDNGDDTGDDNGDNPGDDNGDDTGDDDNGDNPGDDNGDDSGDNNGDEDDVSTGVSAIEAAGQADYYTVYGIKVQNPQPGGIYIRVINGKTSKVVIR